MRNDIPGRMADNEEFTSNGNDRQWVMKDNWIMIDNGEWQTMEDED